MSNVSNLTRTVCFGPYSYQEILTRIELDNPCNGVLGWANTCLSTQWKLIEPGAKWLKV